MAAIESCDTLIIGGTSLTVYPAAGFIRYFSGRNLVLINMSATPYDRDRKSTRLNSSHITRSRMPSSA